MTSSDKKVFAFFREARGLMEELVTLLESFEDEDFQRFFRDFGSSVMRDSDTKSSLRDRMIEMEQIIRAYKGSTDGLSKRLAALEDMEIIFDSIADGKIESLDADKLDNVFDAAKRLFSSIGAVENQEAMPAPIQPIDGSQDSDGVYGLSPVQMRSYELSLATLHAHAVVAQAWISGSAVMQAAGNSEAANSWLQTGEQQLRHALDRYVTERACMLRDAVKHD